MYYAGDLSGRGREVRTKEFHAFRARKVIPLDIDCTVAIEKDDAFSHYFVEALNAGAEAAAIASLCLTWAAIQA